MGAVPKKRIKEIMYLEAEFDDNMNTEVFKLISMSSICRIFDSKQLRDVIGGILSLYALMNRAVFEGEAFRNSLLDDGLQLNALKIRGKPDLSNCIKFVDPELNATFLHYLDSENVCNDYAPIRIRRVSNIFKERFSNLNFPIGFIIAFTGLCLCLMSKKLSKYNHFAWVRQKWKSFLGIVGLNQQFSECGPSYHLMPGLNVCRKIYSFFKLHHELRRRLYLGIMKLSWESGLWGNMCRAVLRFSKGLEINHIVLINTYIVQDHPELTNVEELKSEFRKLQSAFQVFRKENIPEEQWPYIQIMSKLSNDIWSKKKFPIISYLSVQIGKRVRTDLDGYHCELSSEMQDPADRIMSEIINFDSTSQIIQAKPENGSGNVAISTNLKNDEFFELFEISDILEKSLYTLSGVRNFKEDDDLILLPNSIPSIEIKYFKISNDVDAELHEIVCMLNISRIYQNECITEVIGGILSLYAAVDSATWSSNECKIALKTHGFELREILLESANDLANQFMFENDELNDLFFKFLDSARTDHSFHSVMIKRNSVVCRMLKRLFLKTLKVPNIFAYIGMYILPIFKQLDENNYEKWFSHKWSTFCRVTNSYPVPFSELLLPSQNTCCSINSFFYSNFELRRILFLKSFEFLGLSNSTRLIFLVICQNARESELTHMYLINYSILKLRNYLLKMKELKPELLRFARALENIRCMLPSVTGWLYVKLICHPNEVEFLNKNHFPLLLYLSESIRDSKNEPKYAGVGTVTEYFKKVEKSTKMISKFYSDTSTEKSLRKFFDLDFPNGDLLSTLKKEQLKQLTINSMLFSACHDNPLGEIPDDTRKKILEMSMDEVKEKYELFMMQEEFANLLSNILGPLTKITASYSKEEKCKTNSNKDNGRVNLSEEDYPIDSSEDDLLYNLSEFQNNSNEDGLLNDLSEFQNNLNKDDLLNDLSEFQINSSLDGLDLNEFRNNSSEADHLYDFNDIQNDWSRDDLLNDFSEYQNSLL